MFNAQEKASVVQEYIRTGSIAITQRYVVRTMGKRPPSPASIRRWHQRFILTELCMIYNDLEDHELVPRESMLFVNYLMLLL